MFVCFKKGRRNNNDAMSEQQPHDSGVQPHDGDAHAYDGDMVIKSYTYKFCTYKFW